MSTDPTIVIIRDDAYLVAMRRDGEPDVHYAAATEDRAKIVAAAWAENLGWKIYDWCDGQQHNTIAATIGRPDAERCPDCDGWIPSNDAPGIYPGALSRRRDVYICSACGTREALDDMQQAEARRYLYDR